MQHAGPSGAPSPAHDRCTPETASSKKLVGVTARRARLPSRATRSWTPALRSQAADPCCRARERLL